MRTLIIISFILLGIQQNGYALSHSIWNGLLSLNVSSTGTVNYEGFKSDKATLDRYLTHLKTHPPKTDWSANEQKAYWINAYNAFTVKLIIDNWPVKSIQKITKNGKNAWDYSWIKIGTETLSLNDIEHKKLRAKFKDARIHFAVNCASKSCPPLLNKAYLASTLDAQLSTQTKLFINQKSYNQLSADKLVLSPIFKWYKEDFGDLITFISTYSTIKISSKAAIHYTDYDWSLNN